LEFHGFSSFQVKDKSQPVRIIIEAPPQEINAFIDPFYSPNIPRAPNARSKKPVRNVIDPDEEENGK